MERYSLVNLCKGREASHCALDIMISTLSFISFASMVYILVRFVLRRMKGEGGVESPTGKLLSSLICILCVVDMCYHIPDFLLTTDHKAQPILGAMSHGGYGQAPLGVGLFYMTSREAVGMVSIWWHCTIAWWLWSLIVCKRRTQLSIWRHLLLLVLCSAAISAGRYALYRYGGRWGFLASILVYSGVLVPACILAMLYWYFRTIMQLRAASQKAAPPSRKHLRRTSAFPVTVSLSWSSLQNMLSRQSVYGSGGGGGSGRNGRSTDRHTQHTHIDVSRGEDTRVCRNGTDMLAQRDDDADTPVCDTHAHPLTHDDDTRVCATHTSHAPSCAHAQAPDGVSEGGFATRDDATSECASMCSSAGGGACVRGGERRGVRQGESEGGWEGGVVEYKQSEGLYMAHAHGDGTADSLSPSDLYAHRDDARNHGRESSSTAYDHSGESTQDGRGRRKRMRRVRVLEPEEMRDYSVHGPFVCASGVCLDGCGGGGAGGGGGGGGGGVGGDRSIKDGGEVQMCASTDAPESQSPHITRDRMSELVATADRGTSLLKQLDHEGEVGAHQDLIRRLLRISLLVALVWFLGSVFNLWLWLPWFVSGQPPHHTVYVMRTLFTRVIGLMDAMILGGLRTRRQRGEKERIEHRRRGRLESYRAELIKSLTLSRNSVPRNLAARFVSLTRQRTNDQSYAQHASSTVEQMVFGGLEFGGREGVVEGGSDRGSEKGAAARRIRGDAQV